MIDDVSVDLRVAFPDMKGLSASKLQYMRCFALEMPRPTKWPTLLLTTGSLGHDLIDGIPKILA